MSYTDKVDFIHGLDLCERFFFEIVKPLLDEYYPLLEYAACRLGPGSDVLGFDSEQSRDHDWGPKFDLLMNDESLIEELNLFLQEHLRNKTIDGYSTQFEIFGEPDGQNVFINVLPNDHQENTSHAIRLMTIKTFFHQYLNWSIDENEPTIEDWLTFPSQHLATIVRGRVFYQTKQIDLEQIRIRLNFYPNDVWFYLIGCLWQRIGQEEHLMGRAGQANDELGSTLIANRLVRDIMRLVFLLERQYYPYAKWFGTAFRKWTNNGPKLESYLRQIQLASTWQEREKSFNFVYEQLAILTKEILFDGQGDLVTSTSLFHNRPFQVINGGSIGAMIFSKIQNSFIEQLPKIGSTDLFTDSTDVLFPEMRFKLKKIFE